MKVLIMGRMNVGKSSLFNRLVKKKSSLVIDEKGITRDLLTQKTHWWGHDFEVTDSGGLSFGQKEELSLAIREKIQEAIKNTDIIIVMVSAKDSLNAEDFDLMKIVRKSNKPFLLFVNKVDHPKKTATLTAPFYELHPEFLSGSVENNYGLDEIVEWIIYKKRMSKKFNQSTVKKQNLSSQKTSQDLIPKAKESRTRLFVIGRANGGKSLLCNQILGSNRMIVSSKSGTTLDTVTDFFSYNQKNYSVSDNPGSRRGQREEREKISFAKSRSELETADIVLLVLDVRLKAGRQETKLVQICLNKKKPVLLVLNKMDLLKKVPVEQKKHKREEIKKTFHFFPDLPMVFVSAKTGYHKEKLFKTIESLKQKMEFKVSTSELNQFFSKVIKKAPAPVYGTNDVKFYYINQTHKKPPEFIAFTNYPKGVTPAYSRFVVNKIKKQWKLNGIPITFHALEKR